MSLKLIFNNISKMGYIICKPIYINDILNIIKSGNVYLHLNNYNLEEKIKLYARSYYQNINYDINIIKNDYTLNNLESRNKELLLIDNDVSLNLLYNTNQDFKSLLFNSIMKNKITFINFHENNINLYPFNSYGDYMIVSKNNINKYLINSCIDENFIELRNDNILFINNIFSCNRYQSTINNIHNYNYNIYNIFYYLIK